MKEEKNTERNTLESTNHLPDENESKEDDNESVVPESSETELDEKEQSTVETPDQEVTSESVTETSKGETLVEPAAPAAGLPEIADKLGTLNFLMAILTLAVVLIAIRTYFDPMRFIRERKRNVPEPESADKPEAEKKDVSRNGSSAIKDTTGTEDLEKGNSPSLDKKKAPSEGTNRKRTEGNENSLTDTLPQEKETERFPKHQGSKDHFEKSGRQVKDKGDYKSICPDVEPSYEMPDKNRLAGYPDYGFGIERKLVGRLKVADLYNRGENVRMLPTEDENAAFVQYSDGTVEPSPKMMMASNTKGFYDNIQFDYVFFMVNSKDVSVNPVEGKKIRVIDVARPARLQKYGSGFFLHTKGIVKVEEC